jgi:lariat debranching enzyme
MHQKIAIEGCCHGELDKIYNAVREEEARYGQKVDLVLICGDFQVKQKKGGDDITKKKTYQ